MKIVLTEFARPRLFPREARRDTIQDVTAAGFERHLNDHSPVRVLQGYAPFCILHVHPNWTSTRCLTVPVTPANRHLLRSGYEARNSSELPVAGFLIAILYSIALGVAEGGSGVPLDHAAYRRSVDYWSAHANWR